MVEDRDPFVKRRPAVRLQYTGLRSNEPKGRDFTHGCISVWPINQGSLYLIGSHDDSGA